MQILIKKYFLKNSRRYIVFENQWQSYGIFQEILLCICNPTGKPKIPIPYN